jgi:hypothetical protein
MKDIPKDLIDVYKKLLEKINSERSRKQELAKRAISWVAGSQVQLRSDEFMKAISFGYQNTDVEDVISCCHHLLTHNQSHDVVELGHFSIVEFIRDQKAGDFAPVAIHSMIAFLCLNAIYVTARVRKDIELSDEDQSYVQRLSTGSYVAEEDDGDGRHDNEKEHNHDDHAGHDAVRIKKKNSMSFRQYATNLWASHCERVDTKCLAKDKWVTVLESWRELEQVGGQIPQTEATTVSLGANSISHRIPETAAEDFTQWIFMVSCKLFAYLSSINLVVLPNPNLTTCRRFWAL